MHGSRVGHWAEQTWRNIAASTRKSATMDAGAQYMTFVGTAETVWSPTAPLPRPHYDNFPYLVRQKINIVLYCLYLGLQMNAQPDFQVRACECCGNLHFHVFCSFLYSFNVIWHQQELPKLSHMFCLPFVLYSFLGWLGLVARSIPMPNLTIFVGRHDHITQCTREGSNTIALHGTSICASGHEVHRESLPTPTPEVTEIAAEQSHALSRKRNR